MLSFYFFDYLIISDFSDFLLAFERMRCDTHIKMHIELAATNIFSHKDRQIDKLNYLSCFPYSEDNRNFVKNYIRIVRHT